MSAVLAVFHSNESEAVELLQKDEAGQNEIIFKVENNEIINNSFNIPKKENDFIWLETDQRNQLSSKSIHVDDKTTKVVILDALPDSTKSLRVHSQLHSNPPSQKNSDKSIFQNPTGNIFFEAHQGNLNQDNDWIWSYNPSRPGTYQVWLALNTIEAVQMASFFYEDQKPMTTKIHTIKDDQNTSIYLGKVKVEKGKVRKFGLALKTQEGDFKANIPAAGDTEKKISVILIPTTEGKMPEQEGPDSVVVLHSKNSTLQSTKLQYEPQPHKITNGYWVNVGDSFYWDFKVKSPGKYVVEIHQGCGKGQGGSDSQVQCNGQSFPFVVKDTGHFQNFIPRKLGTLEFKEPGIYRLWVKAIKKAKGAVMDVRQLRLIPKI